MIFKVATMFSETPGPRLRKNGKKSGEELRDDYLIPLLEKNPNETLFVDFDGIDGIANSTLDEIFSGIVRKLGKNVIARIRIISNEEPELVDDIQNYMVDEAERIGK